MWVLEDDFKKDAGDLVLEFNEHNAIMYAKGQMIQEMQDNPNRGSSKILEYAKFQVTED